MNEVRTRFAPSPTGFMHIGSLRTALYSYAFAKSYGGKFILRLEDTDRKRLVPGATEKIYEMLKIFGISWDEGPAIGGPFNPYIQSERVATGIYQKYAEKLIGEGYAYYCFCEIKPHEDLENEESVKVELRDQNCRNLTKEEVRQKIASGLKPAIRLRVSEGETVEYHDFVIGKKIAWKTSDIDEAMLLKSDGFPTYHLGVVVDDATMKISHVIRGHDWMPSTPIHLLLYQYLGFDLPQIGHLTDILDPEGGKLSKRKGSVSCEEMLTEGYLPEAILNFIMLLGWAPKDNREIYTLIDFVNEFQKGSLQIANPIFNRKKLDWFNGYWLRKTVDSEYLKLLKPFVPKKADEKVLAKIVPLIKERMIKLADFKSFAGFFFKEPVFKKELFEENAKEQLGAAVVVLKGIKNWTKLEIEKQLQGLIKEKDWNTGQFFMNFRVAITGSKFTPPITDSVVILGKEKTLLRLKRVIDQITQNA